MKTAAALLAFSALTSVAHAQAPPPVPPIADADRVQSYNLSSSTSVVNFNFPLFGDCTDLTVTLNGTPLVLNTDWTCRSQSGRALNVIALPITDIQVVLTPALSTGNLVIEGTWHPRRLTQPTAPGLTRYEYNEAISGLTASLREVKTLAAAGPTSYPWALLTGTPTTLAGYGIASPLPPAQGGMGASNPTGYVYFNGGAPPTFSTVPLPPSGTVSATRPQDFGPITGVAANDTPLIDQAFARANSLGGCVYFPGTTVYGYNGAGEDFPKICMLGDGYQSGAINLAAGKYLVDSNQPWTDFIMNGLYVAGGAGAVRNRSSATDTLSRKTVTNNFFYNYTGPAVAIDSTDSPGWEVSNNTFWAANSTTSVGYANCGLSGGVHIGHNEFRLDAVHVKLGQGGNNTTLDNANDFLRFATGTGRIDVWIVPNTSVANGGPGLVIRDSKFGNENLDPSDYAILYADEGAGAHCGDKLPVFTASAGFINHHHIDNVQVYGTGPATSARSLVYSETPNIFGSGYTNIHVSGTSVKNILQFAVAPPNDSQIGSNIIGPVFFDPGIVGADLAKVGDAPRTTTFLNPYVPTNGVGTAKLIDPINTQDLYDHNLPNSLAATADTGDYANLLTNGINTAGSAGGGVTLAATSDTTGGTDATLATFTAYGIIQVALTAKPVPELPMWIEFDLGPGSSNVGQIRVEVYGLTSFNTVWSEPLAVPAATRRVRLRFDPASPIPSTGNGFGIGIDNVETSGAGTAVIGRMAVYQARAPIGGDVGFGVKYLPNSNSVPASNAPNGGYLYVQAGALKYRGSSGTVTTVAPP